MKLKPYRFNPSLFPAARALPKPSMAASSLAQTSPDFHTSAPPEPPQDLDDVLCSDPRSQEHEGPQSDPSSTDDAPPFSGGSPSRCLSASSRAERAWAHWAKLGRPKLMVAPMVDNSELPFRMLCRKYGAEAAYTPMLHSRIFTEK